jgi:hypothetical protein
VICPSGGCVELVQQIGLFAQACSLKIPARDADGCHPSNGQRILAIILLITERL